MKCLISSPGSLQEQQAGTHLAAHCQAAAAAAYELYVSCESCDLVAETNEATLVRGTAPSCGDNACETEKLARSRFHSHTHTYVHTHICSHSCRNTHKKFTTTLPKSCHWLFMCSESVFHDKRQAHNAHERGGKRKAFIVFCRRDAATAKVDQSNIANAKQTRRQRERQR